jgi:RHS repeat-associated protein
MKSLTFRFSLSLAIALSLGSVSEAQTPPAYLCPTQGFQPWWYWTIPSWGPECYCGPGRPSARSCGGAYSQWPAEEGGVQGFNHFCAYGPEGACGDNTGQLEEQGCADCEMDAPPVVSPLVGLPVSVTTGEMTFTHFDGAVGSLGFSRTYNTARLSPGRYGVFGPGWNSSFDKRLRAISPTVVEHRGADGFATYYEDLAGTGLYEKRRPRGKQAWLENTGLGYKLIRRSGAEEIFSEQGILIEERDAAGVVTTYTRDLDGRLTEVTRQGRSLQILYAGEGTKPIALKVGGEDGTILAAYYYQGGRLGEVRYSGGLPPQAEGYSYTYDTAGRILFVDHLDGTPIEAHEYDGTRALTSEVRGGVGKLTLQYSGVTTVTDALGRQTVYEFQPVGGVKRITKITRPCSACTDGAVEVQEWVYDLVNGYVTSMIDPADKVWTYEHDPITADVISVTDPEGRTTSYTYDEFGRILTESGPGGSSTTYVQSGAGPTSITVAASPANRTTTIEYHAENDARKGKVKKITDPLQGETVLTYTTATGDLATVADPLGNTTTFAYDELAIIANRGLPTSVTDALDKVTRTTYDTRGRVIRVTADDGTFTTIGYDLAGRRSTVTDPMGRRTRYVYDDYSRLRAVIDPMNKATSYDYDLMGNLLALTDANLQITRFEYENHNRVKKMIYPGGAFEVFTYDSRGRLATVVDRKNVTTTFTYDDIGRLTQKSFSDGATPSVNYTYNDAARTSTASNGTDTLSWAYSPAGDLLSETSVANDSTVAYQYDAGGNRIEVKLDGTLFVEYAYDDASRLESITRGTNSYGFGYDIANRRTSMSYPNGITTGYEYDDLNRLTLVAALNPIGIPVAAFGYGHDPSGNRTQKNTLEHAETYKYDPLYRLNRADRQNPDESEAGTWVWRYDAVGNRTNAQANSETTTGHYNEKNQLFSMTGGGSTLWRGTLDEPGLVDFSSATVNGQPARMLPGNVFEANLDLPAGQNTVTIKARDGSGNEATKNYSVNVTGGAASYTYDANGNLETKTEGVDVWVYEWNAMNQLIEVKKGTTVGNATWVARFRYDPIGRRIEKATPVQVTTYTHDGADILRENVTISGSTVTSYYVHGPGIDEPLSKETGGVLTYYHADGLGSIAKETNGSGVVTRTLRYDAWGNIETGARDGFAFTGREWDPETGLYYYRARYYDARSSAFLSEDPASLYGGLNLYKYADANPTTLSDPTGKFVFLPMLLGAGIGALTDIGLQLVMNGGNFDCLDWKQVGVSAGLGALGGGLGSLTRVGRVGAEFSHWIPDRFIRPLSLSGKTANKFYKPLLDVPVVRSFVNSTMNGNYVSPMTHALTDPFRNLKGMTAADKLAAPVRQLLRLPGWLAGSGVGSLGGAANTLANPQCECQK